METDSFLDRLISAGPLSQKDARDFGCVGPVARGSGIATDARRELPYAAYSEHPPELQVHEDGDAMGRIEVRTGEIAESLRLLDRLLGSLPARRSLG